MPRKQNPKEESTESEISSDSQSSILDDSDTSENTSNDNTNENSQSGTEESSGEEKSPEAKTVRYFKRIDPKTGEDIGRYTGITPQQAASKSYTKYLRKIEKNGEKIPKRSNIFIRESTRPSAKKIYAYSASRNKLDKPHKIKIPDVKTGEMKKISYNFRNTVQKIEVPDSILKVMEKRAIEKKEAKLERAAEAAKLAKKSEKKSGKKSAASKKNTSKKTTKVTKKAAPKVTKKAAPKVTKKAASKSASKTTKKSKPNKTSN